MRALSGGRRHDRRGDRRGRRRVEDRTLRVEVRDDGVGGVRPEGSGLQGLRDRVAAVDGRFEVESPNGGGTLVAAVIPIAASPTER